MSTTPLPKRFYESVDTVETGEGFAIRLDGRPMRTPARAEFAVPRRELAEAIAAEWDAQEETIDPQSMPLTRLVNSALDGVRGREGMVADDIASYAGSDLLCYRAAQPEGLVAMQCAHWDPVLRWAETALGARFLIAEGVMHQEQPEEALATIRAAIGELGALELAALHVITTMTGSALLALALARGERDAEAVWTAAHVDEDWQISQWGEDAEASARRAERRREFDAAVRLLMLLDA